jgi:hypothetical protein
MKTKLAIIILCITSVAGFSQNYGASALDLETGKSYSLAITEFRDETDESLRRGWEILREMKESSQRRKEAMERSQIKAQLEEQNRLLRKIAEQK